MAPKRPRDGYLGLEFKLQLRLELRLMLRLRLRFKLGRRLKVGAGFWTEADAQTQGQTPSFHFWAIWANGCCLRTCEQIADTVEFE